MCEGGVAAVGWIQVVCGVRICIVKPQMKDTLKERANLPTQDNRKLLMYTHSIENHL